MVFAFKLHQEAVMKLLLVELKTQESDALDKLIKLVDTPLTSKNLV